MKLKAGQIIADRYEVDELIGSGGMAFVYRAHDMKLDRYVTLKVLKEDYLSDEALMARFPKEARAAAALNHQNIVSIYDHGRDGDVLFIVLEFVAGSSLKDLIIRQAPFDDETTLAIAIQAAEGIYEAHLNNIIHLDIKPQNILVTSTSIVKVADFGIARTAKNTTLTAGPGSMGSVHYFSPEQARGGYIDFKSDIYSLGIVMFEMVTGQLPFDGESDVSVALQQLNDALPSIHRINPHVSESVNRIICRATEKSPAKRYADMQEMIADLKRALAESNIAAAKQDDGFDDKRDSNPTRDIGVVMRNDLKRQKLRQAFGEVDPTPRQQRPAQMPPRPRPHPPQHADVYADEYGEEYGEEYGDNFIDEPVRTYHAPPSKNDSTKRRSAIIMGAVAGLFMTTLFALGAVFLHGLLSVDPPEEVTAPNVVGMYFYDAEEYLYEMGLLLNYLGWEYSDDFDFYHIMEQHTVPGFEMSAGDTLSVTVSNGPRPAVSMPNLLMQHIDYARGVLVNLGLGLVVETRDFLGMVGDEYDEPEYGDDSDDDDDEDNDNYDPAVGASHTVGLVYEQHPPPQSPLSFGSTVILYVFGLNPEPPAILGSTRVPPITGIMVEEALARLAAETLVAAPTYEANMYVEEGRVIRQYPLAYVAVEENTTVEFAVSTGPPEGAANPTPTPTPTQTPPTAQAPAAQPPTTQAPQQPPAQSPPAQTPPPVDTPAPAPDAPAPDAPPAPATRNISLVLWSDVAQQDTDFVHLRIYREDGNAPATIVHDGLVSVDSFPFNLSVEGTGHVAFRFFTIEPDGTQRHRGTERIYFGD